MERKRTHFLVPTSSDGLTRRREKRRSLKTPVFVGYATLQATLGRGPPVLSWEAHVAAKTTGNQPALLTQKSLLIALRVL